MTTEETPAPGITVRRAEGRPTQVFVGGWRVGSYKTERGVSNAVARHAAAAVAQDVAPEWITNRNMDQIQLVQDAQEWRYADKQGRTVRLSITVPATFTSEQAARDAADRLVMSVGPDGHLRMGQVSAEVDDVERCWMCDGPNDAGDEPGYGFMDNGAEVPLCSVACTEAFYNPEGR